MLVRVIAPHFVAGLVVEGETVVEAAPILKWTIGKQRGWLRAYFAEKGWTALIVRLPGGPYRRE
jgi:hypothetical protein